MYRYEENKKKMARKKNEEEYDMKMKCESN